MDAYWTIGGLSIPMTDQDILQGSIEASPLGSVFFRLQNRPNTFKGCLGNADKNMEQS
jgi:hypothetical protein